MDLETLKRLAAEKAVEAVEPGMVLGLGTGSTVYYALLKLGQNVRNGLGIIGIPTSIQTADIAQHEGIKLSDLATYPELDLTIDGADEIDPDLNLIKGLGGALVREKITVEASNRLIIIADQTKVVPHLGSKSPLPVEVVQFGWEVTRNRLSQLCSRVVQRQNREVAYITDNGNYILDCYFERIDNPAQAEVEINNLPGVVENGLFINRAEQAIIATQDGIHIQC
ncbi:ribose 5-phosphate isomerase A [Candidatus Poribacteria bacterium]|nr:ribose 5-phosphate isomerase A [Candidatus Poribacteria bacterium]